MICKILYSTIVKDCRNLEEALYEYGVSCGRKRKLNFDEVSITLDKLRYDVTDKAAYTKIIVKGFCEGLDSP